MTTNGAGQGVMLLPCPFCGTAPTTMGYYNGGYGISCDNHKCHAQPCLFREPDMVGKDFRQIAINDWNTRAPAPPGPAATAGEWIACGERMPECTIESMYGTASKQVIVLFHKPENRFPDMGVMVVACYENHGHEPERHYVWGYLDSEDSTFSRSDDSPTHWMPLPPPPGTVKAAATAGEWIAPGEFVERLPPPVTATAAVKAEAVESALHAALAERDANAQTAKAMSKLHDEAEKEIEELHATIARMERDKDHLLTKEDGEYIRERLREAVKAEAGRGVSEAMALAAGRALCEVTDCGRWDDLRECEQKDCIRDATIIVEAALAVRGKGV